MWNLAPSHHPEYFILIWSVALSVSNISLLLLPLHSSLQNPFRFWHFVQGLPPEQMPFSNSSGWQSFSPIWITGLRVVKGYSPKGKSRHCSQKRGKCLPGRQKHVISGEGNRQKPLICSFSLSYIKLSYKSNIVDPWTIQRWGG